MMRGFCCGSWFDYVCFGGCYTLIVLVFGKGFWVVFVWV